MIIKTIPTLGEIPKDGYIFKDTKFIHNFL